MSIMLAGLVMRSNANTAGAAAGAASRSKSAESVSDITARRLKVLEQRVESLALLALALAETLKKRTGATDAEILDLVNVLDLKDGEADGKLARAARRCEPCGRAVATVHARCLYCGGESLSELPPGTVESLLR